MSLSSVASAESTLSADTTKASPSWTHVKAGYTTSHLKDGFKLSGFDLGGSYLVSENVFLFGDFSDVEDGSRFLGVGISRLSGGAGYRHDITPSTDIYGALSYERMDVDVTFLGMSFNESKDGFGLTAGIKSMLTDRIEAGIEASRITIEDEHEAEFKIHSKYHTNERFAIGVSVARMADIDAFSVFGEMKF